MYKHRNERFKQGLHVEVQNNDIGRAMRKLKKLMQTEKVFQEMREKEYYKKPSEVRNANKAAARKRHLKELAKKRDN